MKTLNTYAVLLGFIAMFTVSFAATANDTLYVNATLIDPSQRTVTANSYLWVVNDKFAYVGTSRPTTSTTQIIDLQHRYVTPGFIDTHAHLSLGAVSFAIDNDNVSLHADHQQAIAIWNAEKLLAHGVTSIRNPGGDTRANIAYREAQQNGQIIGPRAFVAGHIIDTSQLSGLVDTVASDTSIQQAISYQASQGVDYIKLYTGLNEAQVTLAVTTAAAHQLPVIGHLEGLNWQRGAELGIQHFVHAMPIAPDLLDEPARTDYLASARPGTFAFFEWFAAANLASPKVTNMITTLERHQASVDPTLVVFYNAFYGDQEAVVANPELAHAHPDLVNNWRSFYHFNAGWSADDFAKAQATWPKVLQFVKQLYDANILLSVGTDLGNPWVIPGVSYHQELRLLEQAGIEPIDALRLATSNSAKVLGHADQLGQVKAGYLADFVVFSQNPAQDLEHLNSIDMVVQNGAPVHQ